MKKKAIKIATASAIAASGFVAVAPVTSEAAPNVAGEVQRAKHLMYEAMYAYSKPFVATGDLVDREVVYAAYKKGEAQYKYAVNYVNKYAAAKDKAALLADLDNVRTKYLLGRALNYIKSWNALELHVEPAAKALDTAVAAKDEAKILEAKANLAKVYDAQKAELNKAVESSIKEFINGEAAEAVKVSTEAADKVLAEISVPKVEGVSAINLREVEVKFNKALNADEVKKAANYVFGTATNPESVTVSEDGKTVVLALANGNALANYSTTNKLTIKKAVGFSADVVVENLKANDVTVPVAQTVEVVGPRELRVTFSEPLDSTVAASNTVAAFSLNSGALALDTTYAAYSGRTVTIKTLADIADGTHSLKLNAVNIKDNAGYVVSPATLSFEAKKDVAAPTATLLSSTESTATIKFSKPVSGVVGNTNLVFTHTYNSSVNEVNGSAITNPSGDNQTFVVDFGTNKPFPPGSTTIFVKYANANGTIIEDKWGNDYVLTNFTVSTSADVVKPEVTAVDFVDSTKVKVTFSEDVDSTTALTESNYVLKDSTGTAVTVADAQFAAGSTKVVELTTGTINGGTYTLEIKNVKDRSIAQNVLTTVTKSFSATDKVAPTVKDDLTAVTNTQVTQISDKKVKVTFSEAMDAATITDKTNWKFNNVALASDVTVVAADGNKAVIITFPTALDTTDANTDLVLDNATLTLARVKDAAGNWIESFQTQLGIKKYSTVTVTEAQVVGKRSVKLVFDNQVINGAVAADFEVKIGAAAYASIVGVSTTVEGGKTYITLTTASDILNTDAVEVRTVSAANTQGNTVGAKNEYGTVLNFNAAAAVDKLVPTLATTNGVVTLDVDGDGLIDHIKFTFTEAIAAGTVSLDKFAVTGYTVTDAYASTAAPTVATDRTSAVVANATDLYVRVTEKTAFDGNATPTVTVAAGLTDVAGNAFAAITTPKTSVDKVVSLAAVDAKLTKAATSVAGQAGAAEAGATVKIFANDANPASATAVGSATVNADGSFAAITGLTTATAYDVYVVDAAGNISAKLDITTP